MAWGLPDGFDDPREQARYRALGEQLRCLVCQGQSIADSNADLANDLKREVRRMMHEGRTDAEILDYMVARYGDFVLFKPPVKASTYALWYGPFVLLLLGLISWFLLARSRQPDKHARLSHDEQTRLEQLLAAETNPREDS
jgi:cytochrome c-type biogenesis protein CcmH